MVPRVILQYFWCFFFIISFISNGDEPKQFNFLEITITKNCIGQYDFNIYHKNITTTIIQIKPNSYVNPEESGLVS